MLEKAESLSRGRGGPMVLWVWVSELYRGVYLVCGLRLLWVVVVVLLLPTEFWWLWVERERRRGTGAIGSEEGDLC